MIDSQAVASQTPDSALGLLDSQVLIGMPCQACLPIGTLSAKQLTLTVIDRINGACSCGRAPFFMFLF